MLSILPFGASGAVEPVEVNVIGPGSTFQQAGEFFAEADGADDEVRDRNRLPLIILISRGAMPPAQHEAIRARFLRRGPLSRQ